MPQVLSVTQKPLFLLLSCILGLICHSLLRHPGHHTLCQVKELQEVAPFSFSRHRLLREGTAKGWLTSPWPLPRASSIGLAISSCLDACLSLVKWLQMNQWQHTGFESPVLYRLISASHGLKC